MNCHSRKCSCFCDEGSMVNASLFLHWLEAIDDNTRIIISGDHKQLPPIGFGNVFSDLIEMFDDTVVSKLIKPMRQAEKSGILVDANLIRMVMYRQGMAAGLRREDTEFLLQPGHRYFRRPVPCGRNSS